MASQHDGGPPDDPREHLRVVRPHKAPNYAMAEQETSKLPPRPDQPTPSQPRPELPSPPVHLHPTLVATDKGRMLYDLSVRIPAWGGVISMRFLAGKNGSGYIHRENSNKTWSEVPQYITFEEICVLYVSALAARMSAQVEIPDPNIPFDYDPDEGA